MKFTSTLRVTSRGMSEELLQDMSGRGILATGSRFNIVLTPMTVRNMI